MASTKQIGLLAPDRVSSIHQSLRTRTTEGNTTVRILAMIGGVGLISCSVIMGIFYTDAQSYVPIDILISLASLAIGLTACILENNLAFAFAQKLKSPIVDRAPLLKETTWRGVLYSVAGVLQCMVAVHLHILLGLYLISAGVYMIRFGMKATRSLANLCDAMTDEKTLLDKFLEYDQNSDGILEVYEFEGLISSLGVELDHDELEAAFFSIDTNHDQKIAYDEFRAWWKGSSCPTTDVETSIVIVEVPSIAPQDSGLDICANNTDPVLGIDAYAFVPGVDVAMTTSTDPDREAVNTTMVVSDRRADI